MASRVGPDERMKKDGRINPNFAYTDMQQCNDVPSFIPKNIELGDLQKYFDLAHEKLFETNGPGVFRHFQLNLNGYETCSQSHRPLLREQKAQLFKERCKASYPLLKACEKYAPNETVREKVRETEEKYRRLIGEPTDQQKMFAEAFCDIVGKRTEELKNPPSEDTFDPPVRKTYYDPERGPIPFVKKGRGPGEPVQYQVFDEPEPASRR